MTTNTNSIRFAGDVSVTKARITSSTGFFQDITAQVITIQVYEDLFSPFISGSLILKESIDFVNLFPFIGEETLELEITTPAIKTGSIKGTFYIYKLTDRELVGDRSVVYQLHFISPEAVIDLNKKISKIYSGNVGDIVTDVVKDKLNGLQSSKRLKVEPTTQDTAFISNFWSPVKIITYATENAVNRNGSPSYTFFENRDGFNFVSLESLYDQKVYQDFVYDRYSRDNVAGGGTVRNVEKDFKRITSINIATGFDYMDRIMGGAFASKAISYDLTNKKYNVKIYTMFDKYTKQYHLNKFPITSDKLVFRSNALLVNYPRQLNTFNGFEDTSNIKTFQERLSLMKLAESNKISITVPGRTDYTVGQLVSVSLHKVEQITQDDRDIRDKMFSGKYLISAINHHITKKEHECHMELIKESLELDLNKVRK